MTIALRLSLVHFFAWVAVAASPAGAPAAPSIQSLVNEFLVRLEMPCSVTVRIVEAEPQLVSVQRSKEDRDVFVMTFDRAFLESLDTSNLAAVVAHELGHVWIFTHHPYLQTEDLANEKAAQLVPQSSLDRLYEKVRVHMGTPEGSGGNRNEDFQ